MSLYEKDTFIKKYPPHNQQSVAIRGREVKMHLYWAIATTIMVISVSTAMVLIY